MTDETERCEAENTILIVGLLRILLKCVWENTGYFPRNNLDITRTVEIRQFPEENL